jgi:hypothetical protein
LYRSANDFNPEIQEQGNGKHCGAQPVIFATEQRGHYWNFQVTPDALAKRTPSICLSLPHPRSVIHVTDMVPRGCDSFITGSKLSGNRNTPLRRFPIGPIHGYQVKLNFL